MKLSIIVPCYNEEEMVSIFYDTIIEELKKIKINYELIFVNDGSKDKTLDELRKICKKNKKVYVIDLSRNFNKEAAMLAGLEYSTGDYVVVMDADLQDPPNLLREMIKILDTKEYDSVATYRINRKGEPPIRTFFARSFYKLINKMTKVEIVDGARDYRMMTRSMVDSLLKLQEYHRFSKGLFVWVGFKTKYLGYENIERPAGKTKWSFWKLFSYAIEGIVSFTTFPLRIATFSGILISLIAFIYLLYIFVNTLFYGNPVAGWASLACIILFLGGIQLLSIGIIGEYLARTYGEVKRRPVYIIKEVINDDKKN
ncbi:MAG: glycosyltransferase family 2 protein [Bacilli bacterium]|nr:glycosyltransferase family 2 protein [Bacilli bacterium]